MASFKINIADPKTGKCYKTEAKDAQATPFIGLNIGEKIEGTKIGIDGYEFLISGGTDYCGFPMRRGILGIRKKITIYKGLGFRGGLKGMKKRKTVCGHKINETINALNLKVLKEGTKKLSDLFGGKKEESKEEVKEEKPAKKEEKKPEQKEAKEEKKAEPKEEPKKEAKPEQKEAKQETKGQ
ncbi:MAG: S6e family ribosomal protein [Flavobacteriales bacterium]|jgi:small subunit ribosomal protein S6e|nr:S6e family ribosomal protein [Flavobacteriales bacterium]